MFKSFLRQFSPTSTSSEETGVGRKSKQGFSRLNKARLARIEYKISTNAFEGIHLLGPKVFGDCDHKVVCFFWILLPQHRSTHQTTWASNNSPNYLNFSRRMERDPHDSSNGSPSVGDSEQAGDCLQSSLNKFSSTINRVNEDGDIRENKR